MICPDSDDRKIYIAGPMSGHRLYNFPEFFAVAIFLRRHGWDVHNPAEHDMAQGIDPSGPPISEERYNNLMREDILAICCECTDVVFLAGWENSRGARVERAVAEAIGLRLWLWTGTDMIPAIEKAEQPEQPAQPAQEEDSDPC